jgi:ATP-dependent DNA helicase RecQ
VQLLSYFGEKHVTDCGICSVCIAKNSKLVKKDIHLIKEDILSALSQVDLSSRDLAKRIKCSEADIQTNIKILLEHQLISITDKNTYKINKS